MEKEGGEGGGKGPPPFLPFSALINSKFLNELARNRLLGKLPTSSLQRNILLLLEFISIVFCMNNAGGKARF